MPRQEQPGRSLDFYKLTPEEKLKGKNNKTKNKHQQTDAVNAVHVFYKPGFWPVRIRLFNVEIFGELLEYTHKKTAS